MPLTFRGGTHPLIAMHGGKALSSSCAVEVLPAPKTVAIPLSQHAGAPAVPTVAIGERVLMGQVIGEPPGMVSAFVHSSVSGTVRAFETRPSPQGLQVQCVIIDSDGRDEPDPSMQPRDAQTIAALTPEALKDIARAAGLVGMGGAAFPTHVKLSPPPDKPIDTLILNGAECEPYLTCDDRMMRERPDAVIEGGRLMARILGVKRCVIAVEANKHDALKALHHAPHEGMEIRTLRVKYPQGSEKQLIYAVTGRKVPTGKLPMDCGCVVANVTTAVAFRDAVAEGRPVYSRALTVSGSGITTPKNVLVRIGTPVGEVIEHCGGFKGEAYKLLAGGPMMGTALYDLGTPVVKAMSGLTALTQADDKPTHEGPCIRCGRCVEACPMRLMPSTIAAYALKEDWRGTEANSVLNCLECGTCTYVCPAKRNLSAVMRIAKRTAMAAKQQGAR